MLLREWMFFSGETTQSLAEKLNCSISTVTNLKRGRIAEALQTIYELEKLTNGNVTLKDLVLCAKRYKKNKPDEKDESKNS